MARKSGQVGPEQYFEAAMGILGRDGAAGLKIVPLCREIGVTSGSFYHHFDGWPGFVQALLVHWESEQTERIVRLVRASADPLERVSLLKGLAVRLPHEAEAAIRAWAAIDADVGRAQRRVDDERRAALEQVLVEVVVDPVVAARLAAHGLALLAGFQQTCVPPSVEVLAGLFDDFEGLVLVHAERAR